MAVIAGNTVALNNFRNAPARPMVMKVFHNPPFLIKLQASAKQGFSQKRLTLNSVEQVPFVIEAPGSIHPNSTSGHSGFAPIRTIESPCSLLTLIADLTVAANAALSA